MTHAKGEDKSTTTRVVSTRMREDERLLLEVVRRRLKHRHLSDTVAFACHRLIEEELGPDALKAA